MLCRQSMCAFGVCLWSSVQQHLFICNLFFLNVLQSVWCRVSQPSHHDSGWLVWSAPAERMFTWPGHTTQCRCFCRTCIFLWLSSVYQIIKWLCLSSTADGDAEEDERAERERKEENDDEEALQKARDWDDWKDTHRRGYGNRKNMGWSDFTQTHTHVCSSLQFPQINLPMLPMCDMDTTESGAVVVS